MLIEGEWIGVGVLVILAWLVRTRLNPHLLGVGMLLVLIALIAKAMGG